VEPSKGPQADGKGLRFSLTAILAIVFVLLSAWQVGIAQDPAPPPSEEGDLAPIVEDTEVGQRTPFDETIEGYFLHPVWLVILLICAFLWVVVLEFVSEDARRVKADQKNWNLIFLGLGLIGLTLAILLAPVFALLGLAAVIGTASVYVAKRNQMVNPEQRVFTKAHLAYVLSRVLTKVGIKVSQQKLIGTPEDETEIELLRKDGKSLDAISGEARSGVEHSEATLGVKEIVESAILSRATDIHIEPKENELQVRFRIDGILHNVPSYPVELAPPIVSAIKVLADMDIAERRKPQDGTFMGRLGGKTLDFRAATSPSVHGETMVVRILDRETGLLGLAHLGLDQRRFEKIQSIISAPHGMLIVSGPTGAGKTTTLYAALGAIDAYQKNIITIENPIEYRLDNVTQTQVNPKAGITFANQLRSMLRQDPDVIMVGEIRDAETARTALQAAMTGHFVFTTIHANDAVSSLFRLLDLGVEPYLISSSLSAVLAQRLVRTLCEECKVPYIPKPSFVKKVGLDPRRVQEFFKATGCEACQGTGYLGRIGVFELLEMNDTLRDLIRGTPSVQLIKAEARKNGLITLQEDGLSKVSRGITSVKELIRVTK